MSAGQLDAKSCMADCIFFEKENDFCTTFLGGWPICLKFKHFLSQLSFNIVTSQVLHIFHIYLLKKLPFYKEIQA